MTLGQEIKYYRKKNGLTQTAFGDLFGMSKQAVYSWETGLYSPDISVLLKMADFFQIPICVLVGRPGMYCQKSDDTRSNCDYCAPITDEDCLVIRALFLPGPGKYAMMRKNEKERYAMESLLRSVYGRAEAEYVIKKSRFIATVCEVKTEEEAAAFIESVRKHYWDARHNCSAFQIGAGGQIQRSSDDGEPSGTAGRPILEVLKKRDLTNTAVVVTRYFGGIKLGASGLIRAYSHAATLALDEASVVVYTPFTLLTATVAYPLVSTLERFAESHGVLIADRAFAADVTFTFEVPEDDSDAFIADLTNTANGRVSCKKRLFVKCWGAN